MATAAYKGWNEKSLWTIFEACCLVYGVEPPAASNISERINALPADSRRSIEVLYGHAKDALDLEVLKPVSSRDGQYQNMRLKPVDFLAWAKSRDVKIPAA